MHAFFARLLDLQSENMIGRVVHKRRRVEEPVFQRLPQGDPQTRIVLAHQLHQIEEGGFSLTAAGRGRGQPGVVVQQPAILIGVSGLGRVRVPVQHESVLADAFVVLGPRSAAHVAGHRLAQDLLHHGQMFSVIVSLEQGVTLLKEKKKKLVTKSASRTAALVFKRSKMHLNGASSTTTTILTRRPSSKLFLFTETANKLIRLRSDLAFTIFFPRF